MNNTNNKQKGAVSLFVVVFAALLITVITVSFVRNMIQDQSQASVTDLSQSAFDSAKAGSEDAKRALLRYQSICNSGSASECIAAQTEINSSICNDAVSKLNNTAQVNNEVKIQTNGSNKLDQAYTCVKINLDTDDYIGILDQDASKFIPLVGVSDFNTIRLEWFSTTKDVQNVLLGSTQITPTKIDVPAFSAGTPLLTQSNWSLPSAPNRPPIMRTQFIQFMNGGFNLTDFETNHNGASSQTLFLYPSNIGPSVKSFNSDVQKSTKSLTQIHCESSLSVAIYSCSVDISLPAMIRKGERTAYLNLTAIYKKTNYRVTLSNSGTRVKFNAVQPEIDSTGRANDLFRRVMDRVELTDINFPYPAAAVDITGNFCKYFQVTDKSEDYPGSINCTP